MYWYGIHVHDDKNQSVKQIDIKKYVLNDLISDLLETISTYTWSKNYNFNSLILVGVQK
jgi:hypothetical protein